MATYMSATGKVEDQAYKNLLAYVVSNTISGEIMAIDNYTAMVPLLDDVDEKIETVHQARDEAAHVRMLSKLGKRVDFPTIQRIIEPQWKEIGRFVQEKSRDRNLTACLIAQDIMVETFATVAYAALQRNTDNATRSLAATIMKDEVAHLQIGIDRMQRMLDVDEEDVHKSFEEAHRQVMPAMMSMVNYNCFSLCGQLDIKCSTVSLDSIEQDLDTLRVDAIDTYMSKVDAIGLDPNRIAPLMSSLVDDDASNWQPKQASDIASSACCG